MDPHSPTELDVEAERRLDEFSREFAQYAGVLAEVISRWHEPKVARAVVESVITGDGGRFQTLIDVDVPIPPLDRCVWISEVVEKVVPAPTELVCRLRRFLSPEERRRYFALVIEFRQRGELPQVDSTAADPVIPPGPFLDALKAEGLVDCAPEPMGSGLELALEPPRRFCV